MEIKEKIINLLNEEYNTFLSLDDITTLLMKENDYQKDDIINSVNELINDYILYKSKKGRYGLLKSFNLYVGRIILKKQGYGFFKSNELDEDAFIPACDLDNAIDNDTVLCYVDPHSDMGEKQKKEGRVVNIIKHNNDLVCKVIFKNFNFDNKKLICESYPDINIEVDDYKLAVVDDIVLVRVIEADLLLKHVIKGEIKKIIGNINDIGIDIKSVCVKYGLEDDFSEEVYNNLEEVNKQYIDNLENEKSKRRFVNRNIITIDGEDAKDLDDAVSVEKLKNGNYSLGVYIADVSHFVNKDSEIDKEALNRATSVYLTDRVIPMLPHKLCNDLCSLNEKNPKYVMACEMEIDKNGNVINYDIFEGLIISNHRMTYTNVNKIIHYINNDDIDYNDIEAYNDIFDMVKDMNDLSHILNRMRVNRGSLNFDIPEAKIIVNNKGKAVDVQLRVRDEAERLIEEFMLIANETVACAVTDLELPFIYRVHDEPNSLKLDKFKRILRNTKYSIKCKGKNITPLALQNLLNEVNDDDSAVSTMLLRMMAKAEYSSENIGHYGLASKCYTHFTSPIRRYPDLLVHRLLKKYIVHSEDFYSSYDTGKEAELRAYIDEIAKWSSDREVNANLCEFEVDDMKKAEYMEDHIGEKFVGKITSVTNFGLFVTLPNTIEGLVHIRTLSDDYYEFDEFKMSLIGRSTKNVYRLGDSVEIIVSDANKESKEIDFKISSKTRKAKDSMLKYTKGVYNDKNKQSNKRKFSQRRNKDHRQK